ncbi:hypothetical protein J19TS1_46730 [Heyndrickxia oleronia]|nr:hypothetical protein J19TS1_46730 [Heyndrickxia oleronia]
MKQEPIYSLEVPLFIITITDVLRWKKVSIFLFNIEDFFSTTS